MPLKPRDLDLPEAPGVYLFRTDSGVVLYVGKATNIKNRVRSYFSPNPDRAMIPKLVSSSDDVDFIVTGSPGEALVLEKQLIRKHKPRYNSMFKDDKSYPFIAITKHEYPRIIYTRRPPKGSKIWGPFPDAGAAKRVIKLLRRQFGIRDERDNVPFGYDDQGGLEDYIGRIRVAESVLDGNADSIIKHLQRNMDIASEAMQYEKAASFRDMIAIIQKTISDQIIRSRFYTEVHAIGFASRGDFGNAVIIQADEGVIQGQVTYPMIHRGDVGESVSLLVAEHYSSQRPPKILLTPSNLGEELRQWLCERRGTAVEVRIPQRGKLAKLRRLADRNAELHVERAKSRSSGRVEHQAAEDAAKLLGMDSLNHVVCFDMAQLLGESRVGASVVFRNGRPKKSEYRTYRVKDDAADDLRMMAGVVERWLKHQNEWPDLVILDGGKTHLSAVLSMLDSHGLAGVFPVIALAKREETVFTKDGWEFVLDRKGRMIVHARDEAHRFVNSYHRRKRSKGSLRNPLENVEGLGAKKIQTLLRHFGGIQGIEHASLEELKAIQGIGKELAKRIQGSFNKY